MLIVLKLDALNVMKLTNRNITSRCKIEWVINEIIVLLDGIVLQLSMLPMSATRRSHLLAKFAIKVQISKFGWKILLTKFVILLCKNPNSVCRFFFLMYECLF